MHDDLFDQTQPVFLQIEGAEAHILINRPAQKNAFSTAMWQRVAGACTLLRARRDIRLVTVRSAAAGVFASGIDIAELAEKRTDPAWVEENRLAIRAAQRGLAELPMPSIALVDGPAVGGGCGLALHCDLRLASVRSRFGITPARLGLTYPLSDMRRLMGLVGEQGARRLLLTAELIGAAEALQMGLVDSVADTDELSRTYDGWKARILALSPASLAQIKGQIARVAAGQQDDDAISISDFNGAHTGADAAEGIDAFLAKRSARFSNR